jgi:hypothetical protein
MRIAKIQQELAQLDELRTKVAQDTEGAHLIARIGSLDAINARFRLLGLSGTRSE